MRICVFSERMAEPFDEGIKNYVLHLARELAKQHQVLTLTAFGQTLPARGIRNVWGNRLLLSPSLAYHIARFRPDLIFYVPTACATVFSFFRSRVLKLYGLGAPAAMIALQMRSYGWLSRIMIPRLQPDVVLVQSQATLNSLREFGGQLRLLPPGIDAERFAPVTPDRRLELRARYGLDPRHYIVLHVGHLNRGRNIQSLLHLQRRPGMHVIVVGSTSTEHDIALVEELTRAGVRVIREYVPDIAEIYQLADCYVFPVNAETNSIDIPLSVLEAMACDLPVVTTRFGGLPVLFEGNQGFRYVDGPEQMVDAVEACKWLREAGTRAMVEPYSWPHIAQQLVASFGAR